MSLIDRESCTSLGSPGSSVDETMEKKVLEEDQQETVALAAKAKVMAGPRDEGGSKKRRHGAISSVESGLLVKGKPSNKQRRALLVDDKPRKGAEQRKQIHAAAAAGPPLVVKQQLLSTYSVLRNPLPCQQVHDRTEQHVLPTPPSNIPSRYHPCKKTSTEPILKGETDHTIQLLERSSPVITAPPLQFPLLDPHVHESTEKAPVDVDPKTTLLLQHPAPSSSSSWRHALWLVGFALGWMWWLLLDNHSEKDATIHSVVDAGILERMLSSILVEATRFMTSFSVPTTISSSYWESGAYYLYPVVSILGGIWVLWLHHQQKQPSPRRRRAEIGRLHQLALYYVERRNHSRANGGDLDLEYLRATVLGSSFKRKKKHLWPLVVQTLQKDQRIRFDRVVSPSGGRACTMVSWVGVEPQKKSLSKAAKPTKKSRRRVTFSISSADEEEILRMRKERRSTAWKQ